MLQQAQDNLFSARQTNNKSPEDELDIELFIDLVRQFTVIWNTGLNGFKDYNKKKVVWNNINSSFNLVPSTSFRYKMKAKKSFCISKEVYFKEIFVDFSGDKVTQ